MNILKNPVLNVKTSASSLAIDLTTVKNFLKIDFSDDDELITKMIKTASSQCETYINKTLIETTYVYSLYELKGLSVILPFSPIKSISEINSIALDGTSTSVSSSSYNLDTVSGILNFKNEVNFYRLDIEYIAGLTTVNDELIQGLLMHIARMYEDRSGYASIPTNSLNIYKKYRQIRL